jgi:hypothetical protein
MSTSTIYWKVRDTLVNWGVLSRPRFTLRRQPVGAVRAALSAGSGRRRFRRVPLARLLA